jgi:hypothetical protein
MLPDYPILKRELAEALNEQLRRRVHARLGIVKEFGHRRVHEGRSTLIARADGSEQLAGFEQLDTSLNMTRAEIRDLDPSVLFHRIDAAAEELARQQSKYAFKAIEDAAAAATNVVEGKGEFSVELFLEAFGKLEIEFESDGKPRFPCLVIHPTAAEDVVRALRVLESDQKLKARFDVLIETKREEWRAREASRKLVG